MFPGNRPANVTPDPELNITGPLKPVFPGSRSNATADPLRDGDHGARKAPLLPFGLPVGTAVTHLPENVSTGQAHNASHGGEGGNPKVPGAPSGVAGTATGATTVSLHWTAPSDTGASAIIGYHVQKSTDGGTTWSNTAVEFDSDTATTHTITGLTTATGYKFKVAADNGVGLGAYSAASATITTS